MRTSCANSVNACEKWRLAGKYIDSGKNFDGVTSDLVYQVEMVNPGTLEFAYFVDAEQNFDFLSFYIDGTEQFRASRQLTWKPMFYNLTRGYHMLKWSYTKDFSVSRGEDIAKIQYISLDGTHDVVIDCRKCPPGSYKNGDMISCAPCPENQFSRGWGNSQCENCPFGQESFPGSTQCFPSSKPCRESDVYSTFGSCQNDQRTETFQFIKPILCNVSHPESITLPSPRSTTCQQECLPGQFLENGVCLYCPYGKYKDDTTSSCTICAPGNSIHHDNNYITQFSEGGSFFKTGCFGSCKSGGWRMAGNYTDSGLGNGISDSWLEFDVDMKRFGNVIVDHQLSCLEKSGSLSISVNGQVVSIAQCRGCSTSTTSTRIPIPTGSHTIRIGFATSSGYSSDWTCDRATVSRITVQNSQFASGGVDCQPCREGTKSTSPYECTPCSPGFFSPQQSTQCSECQNDYFSHKAGSASCQACGAGFFARFSPRDHCDWVVGQNQWLVPFNGTQKMFDWTELVSMVKETFYPIKGTFLRLNLDMDPTLCKGFVCQLANGTLTSMSESASLTYNGQVLVMATRSLDHKFNDTKINLWCSTNAGRDFDPSKDVTVSQGLIDVYSQYGCPLCANSDYEANIGVCISGKRNVVYRKISVCTRGISKNATSVECTSTIRFPYWAVIVFPLLGIAFLAAGIALVVFLWWRYKRLENEYSQMMDRQKENDVNDETMNNDEIVTNNIVNAKDVVTNQLDEYDDLKL